VVRPAQPFNPVLVVLAGLCALFFVLPLVGLVVRTPWASALGILSDQDVQSALKLSVVCSLASTALACVLGVPLAWVLARLQFPGKSLLRGLTTLPMVLPPVVGGVALLLAFGRRGLIGEPIATVTGFSLPFTTPGVIVAEAFVAMPFMVITVEAGLRSMDVRFEEAARTLGARRWTVFRRVTLPLIGPSLAAGRSLPGREPWVSSAPPSRSRATSRAPPRRPRSPSTSTSSRRRCRARSCSACS